jgi:hypothetical protein
MSARVTENGPELFIRNDEEDDLIIFLSGIEELIAYLFGEE